MQSIFNMFRKGKSPSPKDPEPVSHQPAENTRGPDWTPHIVPPMDDSDYTLSPTPGSSPLRDHATGKNKTKSKSKPQERIVTMDNLKTIDAELKKIETPEATKKASAAVRKKQAPSKNSKNSENQTYGQQLKKLIGVESDSEGSSDDMLQDESESDGEWEEALRNTRRRPGGF